MRHNGPVDLIAFTHSQRFPDWFQSSDYVFCNIPDTPDVVFLAKGCGNLRDTVGCVFDLYMDIAFSDKLMKYQPILTNIRQLGYVCDVDVISGSQVMCVMLM